MAGAEGAEGLGYDQGLQQHTLHIGATSFRWQVYDQADAEPRFTFDNALAPSVATSLHGGT